MKLLFIHPKLAVCVDLGFCVDPNECATHITTEFEVIPSCGVREDIQRLSEYSNVCDVSKLHINETRKR